jgi:hypothetical protein
MNWLNKIASKEFACKQNLEKIKNNKWRLFDEVTSDEFWFYHRHIGKKKPDSKYVIKFIMIIMLRSLINFSKK